MPAESSEESSEREREPAKTQKRPHEEQWDKVERNNKEPVERSSFDRGNMMNDETVRIGDQDDKDHEESARDGKYSPDDEILDPGLEDIQTFEGGRGEIQERGEGRRFAALIVQGIHSFSQVESSDSAEKSEKGCKSHQNP